MAVCACFIAISANAQEKKQEKKKAKTEKTATTDSKKSCDMTEKKGSCCAKK